MNFKVLGEIKNKHHNVVAQLRFYPEDTSGYPFIALTESSKYSKAYKTLEAVAKDWEIAEREE